MRDAQRPNVPDDPVPGVGLLNASVLKGPPRPGRSTPPYSVERYRLYAESLSPFTHASAWNWPNFGLLTTSVASSSLAAIGG